MGDDATRILTEAEHHEAAKAGDRAAGLAPGTRIDRYIVLEPVGSGGMGTVYAAYDPMLDRKIALKLLHARDAPATGTSHDGQSRLLREAQAIARLSHPNVLSVYDVGAVGEQVYMAMELIEGIPLRTWIKTARRPWREALGYLRQAGRGLAAAHAAGLVHRDFKPANVLIGKDGRVRVLDFGLARVAVRDRHETLDSQGSVPTPSIGQIVHAEHTDDEIVVGTPAYMAPEQYGGRSNERTDQFAFCVTLYEALCGRRPYPARTVEQLEEAVRSGKAEFPEDVQVPAWLRRVVLRGLRPDPDQRFPSIQALLDELERDTVFQRHRGLVIGGVAAALVLVGVGSWRAAELAASARCEGARERLAGIWDEDARARIQRAFTATGQSYAAPAFEAVSAVLDRRSDAWVGSHTDACEATHVRGDQSTDLLDLRMACLQDVRAELVALTEILAEADAAVVEHAVEAAHALPDTDRCEDLDALLREPGNPDLSAEDRTRADAIRADLARARALTHTGRFGPARTVAAGAVDRATGALATLRAEALLERGRAEDRGGDPKEAEVSLNEAIWAAERNGQDGLRAAATTELVWVVGHRLARPEEALRIAGHARSTVDRTGREDLRIPLLQYTGVIGVETASSDGGLKDLHAALELVEARGLGDTPEAAALLNRIGASLISRGDHEAALPYFERSLEMRVRLLGEEHPVVSTSLGNVAMAMHARGEAERARDMYLRSLAVDEKNHGPSSYELVRGLTNLGAIQAELGDHAAARKTQERVISIVEATVGNKHPLMGSGLHGLGVSLVGLGELDAALEAHEQALAIWEETYGMEHPYVGHALHAVGDLKRRLGQLASARPLLERGLKIRGANRDAEPRLWAETAFALAQSMEPASRARARELAAESAERFDQAGRADDARTVRTWLEQNGK